MEFSSLAPNGSFPPPKPKRKSVNFEFDEYIPHHSDFLRELKSMKNETAEEILKDIEENTGKDDIEQEVFSNREIPFERFDNVPRSKTLDFHGFRSKRFMKIDSREIFQAFNQNKVRRKSSLSQALSFSKVSIHKIN